MSEILKTADGLEFVRTPDDRFDGLSDFAWSPHHAEVDGLRMAYVDEGPADGDVALLLHGEPSWSYLYRFMIPPLLEAGMRVVAPDLIGFGRSDKPIHQDDYTYARHVAWITGLVTQLELEDISLFCQDWGGLAGLRVVAENAGRFAYLTIANTALPEGDGMGEGFANWQDFSQVVDPFDSGFLLQGGTHRELTDAEVDAYRAPFPDDNHLAGARRFPMLVPTSPDDPAVPANRAAWEVLERWDRPVAVPWAPNDPVLGPLQSAFTERIPGARGREHPTFEAASHFIQEDVGPELAQVMIDLRAG